MKKIVVDFETYYDTEYSLSNMQTDEYVLDARYQTIGVAVKEDDGPVRWFSDQDELAIAAWLTNSFDWGNAAAICHNTLFDGFIMTQRFGIRPKLWMDTLSMGRMICPYLPSHSLASLAKHFKLQDKGTYVLDALGKRREAFTPEELRMYSEYCCTDVQITSELANILLPQVPALDLKLIDMTVRMFTEPQLVGDEKMLEQLYLAEAARKDELLSAAGIARDAVMSNDKLALALEGLGVTPPTKVSARTGQVAFAFAKTDKAFVELLNHDNPQVQALVAARLGVKTTIAETRAKRMWDTSRRACMLRGEIRPLAGTLPRRSVRGALPVYLQFWGAKTTGRYSGGNKVNWQNLPARGSSAGLRKAILAPAGHKVLVGDSSNIELRVAMCAAGQNDVVAKIASGVDLYCDFATRLFGRTITKQDKKERTLGKIAMLSLQYGAGWVKFKEMVRIQAGEILADNSAEQIVGLYRSVHSDITRMWDFLEDAVLPEIQNGCPNLLPVDKHAWCLATGEGFGIGGGIGVVYHQLRREMSTKPDRPMPQWVYTAGKETVNLYGGKVFENYCQYVARQIVMWQTARINERYPVALSVHDEVVCVVKDEEVAEARMYMEECLSIAPPWCRGAIPLACETGVGQSYGDAK